MGTKKDKNGRDLVDDEEIKKRWKDITWKNCIKKVLMNWITMMVWLVSLSQTFWSVRPSWP